MTYSVIVSWGPYAKQVSRDGMTAYIVRGKPGRWANTNDCCLHEPVAADTVAAAKKSAMAEHREKCMAASA